MKRKGQIASYWKMSTLVMGLSALVLVTLAAYAPGFAAAADISLPATDPGQAGTHCSEAATQGDPSRNYGTFTSCWTDVADQASIADPNVVALDRNYGTFTSVWADAADQAGVADPNVVALDRNYGTFTSVWADVADQAGVADPNVVALDRNYGTFTSMWTDF